MQPCFLLVDRSVGYREWETMGSDQHHQVEDKEGAPLYPVLHTSSWASPFQALFTVFLLILEDKTDQVLSPQCLAHIGCSVNAG